jgi:hypothetical protein
MGEAKICVQIGLTGKEESNTPNFIMPDIIQEIQAIASRVPIADNGLVSDPSDDLSKLGFILDETEKPKSTTTTVELELIKTIVGNEQEPKARDANVAEIVAES